MSSTRSRTATTRRGSHSLQCRLRTLGLPILFEFLLDLIDFLVRIHVLEILTFLFDGVEVEVTLAFSKMFGFERLGTVFGIHGVDEGCLFVVAQVFEGGDVEGGHHVVVFVDKVVAVKHVEAIPSASSIVSVKVVEDVQEAVYLRAIASEDLDFFILVEPYDILQCSLLVRKNSASSATAADNLEVDKVNVDWL